jgi:hypothetical protein
MEHGFEFSSPRNYLQVAPDQPPTIDISQPDENLLAIIGREMNVTIRARDDYGIADAEITYQVNLRPPVTVSLPGPITNGGGDQPLEWDYRNAVTNLQVGDTVAFSVQVRDRYAGEGGPHVARSDTRRITFLSKEDYLAEIAKRKDRLLSRLRGIYRQERTAHQLVLDLNAKDSGYEQSVQLESARQEMLRGQLHEIVDGVQELLDDLAANNVSDAAEGDMLDELSASLNAVAEDKVARAAELLREQGNPLDNGGVHDVRPVAHAIDLAARDMGRLVLQRDIDSALEVFAREARAIAQNSAEFKRESVASDAVSQQKRAALASSQIALADWTRVLLNDLEAGMQYTKRPLGVLSLTRQIKSLRAQGVTESMSATAALLEKGVIDEALEKQNDVIHALLAAEAIVRRDIEYRTLLTARDRLLSIQSQIKNDDTPLSTLREDLAGLLLPPIPAPRTRLFDKAPAAVPEVNKAIHNTLAAMAKSGDAGSIAEQLDNLIRIVSDRTEEALVETVGFGQVAATVGDWGMRLSDFETQQIGLLEKVDMAAADKQPCAPVAEAQATLIKDLKRFKEDILRDNERVKLPESGLAPLLGRIDAVIDTMNKVMPSLRQNEHDPAIELQDQAAYALTDIYVTLEAQSKRYSMLENLLALERSVRKSTRYVDDIASEQADILKAIEQAEKDDLPALIPVQQNLRQCITDVTPLLDFVAGQLDVGTPLAFTGADIEDAVAALEIKDSIEAIDALSAAKDSMEEVTVKMFAMSRQVAYVAEVVAAMNTAFGDAAFAAYEQEQLAHELKGGKAKITGTLEAQQAALVSRVKELDQRIALIAGTTTNLVAAAPLVSIASEGLKQQDPAASHDQMMEAAKSLGQNANGVLSCIEMLYGLPQLQVASDTDEVYLRLLDVLAIAADHHVFLRDAQRAGKNKDQALAGAQAKLVTRCAKYSQGDNPHPKLVSAQQHLARAAELLKASTPADAITAQEDAGTNLRHFVIEQSLVLNTAVPPPPPSDPDAPPSEAGDAAGADLASSIGIVGGFVSGELPKNQRSEWEILKERNRAALHENFARELPLEYRSMLKSYFEGVAK